MDAQSPRPWQGVMLQINPESAEILAATVVAQTPEGHRTIEAMLKTLLASLSGATSSN